MSADQADRAISLPTEPGRENWLRLVRNKQRERFGPAHLRRRRDFARRIERSEVFLCSRCEEEIGADLALDWASITTTVIRRRAIPLTAAVTEQRRIR